MSQFSSEATLQPLSISGRNLVNQRRKPRIWTYIGALSLMGATASVACGNGSSSPGASTCSLAGNRCQYGCSDTLGCVECLSNADCTNGNPICVLGRCGECATTTDCNTGQVCEPATHTCNAACTTNANCTRNGQGNNAAPICNTATSTCVGCTANTDCTGSRPLCDANRMQCSECLSRSNCGVATPACDAQTGDCVECLVDADCTGKNACGADHVCHPICTVNADCASTTGRPICEAATGACVACAANSDCAKNTANGRLTCNAQNHTCVACLANTDCPPASPICHVNGGGAGLMNQCVQCETSTNCTTAAAARCNMQQGQCEACQTNADCSLLTSTPTCTNGTCA